MEHLFGRSSALALGLLLVAAPAVRAQDSTSRTPGVVGLDSAQAAKATACKSLQAYGKQATADGLKKLREEGRLGLVLDSAMGVIQRSPAKADDTIREVLGFKTLPDSVQAFAATASPSCKLMPAQASFQRMVDTEMKRMPRIGIMMAPLTPQAKQAVALAGDTTGLLVQSVVAGLGAQAAGVVAGDVVLGMNGKPAASVIDFRQLSLGWKEGDTAKLLLARKGGVRETVDVKVMVKE